VLVGIVSSSPRRWIDAAVAGYDTTFDTIVSVEDIDAPGKPNPAVYEHAMDGLGVDPDSCLVVEDSETGIEAAAAAGASVVRYQSYDDTEDHPKADVITSDKAALRDQLRRRLPG
jgi:haloacid dehalogenase superfamily, subfamily IA, variant 3 with third motif having DD or ED/haloacid dehalogenase superfamily, subfamily IA, variant 1 with third motif having Dx(3-4)D or Dx(3-4)E